MIEKSSIYRVMRMAAKEQTEEAPAPMQAAVQSRRYYFFDAEPENSIAFTALQDILKGNSPEKNALVSKLQGGNSGEYMADYFMWKKVAVHTNRYSQNGKTWLVYECQLSPMGSKIAGSAQVTPSDTAVTPERVEEDFLLFEEKRGNADIVNVDPTGESYYVDQDPPGNLARILLSGARPAGNVLNYQNFIKKFDEYRIWVANLNQLLLPNFETPRTDDVPGGHYVGGERAYQRYVAPHVKEKAEEKQQPQEQSGKKPEEKPEGEDMKKPKKEESTFQPVDEQGPQEPTKGKILDNPAARTASKKKKKKHKSKGDYATEPYGGGWDILQRLVEEQREHMDIRRAAKNVVAQYSMSQPVKPGTSSSSSSSSSEGNKVPTTSEEAEQMEEESTKRSELYKKQKELLKSMEQQQQQMSQMMKGAASQVISRFLRK